MKTIPRKVSLLTSAATFFWLLTLALAASVQGAEPPKGKLVIVGGGTTPPGLHRQMLDFAGGTNARVLVIAHASAATNAGVGSVEAFLKAGAANVSNLTTTNRAEALAAVRAAEEIWFPGGNQSRLMTELKRLGLVEAIRERHAAGAVIGGTSAGAAVMSKVMITGSPKQAGEIPPLAEGLGLWPAAIVDQHFVLRKREPRLQAAVKANPKLLGVGIDESTYIVVTGSGFEVCGESVVIVLDGRSEPELRRVEMKAGQKFSGDQ